MKARKCASGLDEPWWCNVPMAMLEVLVAGLFTVAGMVLIWMGIGLVLEIWSHLSSIPATFMPPS